MVINPTTFPPARLATLAGLLNLIVPTLLIGAGIILFIMIIIAGFQYMGSSGDSEKLKKAQETLKYSAIGFVIVIASFFIVKLLSSIFNINTPL